MHIRDEKVPSARQLARIGQELSREAQFRPAWMDFYGTGGGMQLWPAAVSTFAARPSTAGGDASILRTSTPRRADSIVPIAGGSRLGRRSEPIRSCARAAAFPTWELIVLPRGSLPPRLCAVRKSKKYRALQPGDLVQVETLDRCPA